MERAFGTFSRSLTLPKGVNADAVAASFDRGVLEVRIPKPEQAKPRRISINAARRPEGRSRATRRPRSRIPTHPRARGLLRAGGDRLVDACP